jgi:hypothetical protein
MYEPKNALTIAIMAEYWQKLQLGISRSQIMAQMRLSYSTAITLEHAAAAAYATKKTIIRSIPDIDPQDPVDQEHHYAETDTDKAHTPPSPKRLFVLPEPRVKMVRPPARYSNRSPYGVASPGLE